MKGMPFARGKKNAFFIVKKTLKLSPATWAEKWNGKQVLLNPIKITRAIKALTQMVDM